MKLDTAAIERRAKETLSVCASAHMLVGKERAANLADACISLIAALRESEAEREDLREMEEVYLRCGDALAQEGIAYTASLWEQVITSINRTFDAKERIKELEAERAKLMNVVDAARIHVAFARAKEDCGSCLASCPNAQDGDLGCECGGSWMSIAVADLDAPADGGEKK